MGAPPEPALALMPPWLVAPPPLGGAPPLLKPVPAAPALEPLPEAPPPLGLLPPVAPAWLLPPATALPPAEALLLPGALPPGELQDATQAAMDATTAAEMTA